MLTGTPGRPSSGLVALLYSPTEVKASVANDTEVKVVEGTNYPFRETIKYALKLGEEWKTVINDKDPIDCGNLYLYVRPTTA